MKPVLLIILDGFGVAPPGPGNPIYLANPPTINSFFYTYPNTTLRASGEAVGLPKGEAGNTEVGHINLGAGRIIYQDLPRINMSIADGTFYKNDAFLKAVQHVNTTKGTLHILGLVGEGAVHSSIEHLFALLFFAREQKLTNVVVHAITDGRDSPPKSAAGTLKQLEEKMSELGIGKIASVAGRYWAMDRDKRWERIQKAYECYTEGKGNTAKTAEEAVMNSYRDQKTDEFIEPTMIVGDGEQPHIVKDGDAVIFFNFRIDRPRELTKAFILDDFEVTANTSMATAYDPFATKHMRTHLSPPTTGAPPFTRNVKVKNLFFVTMTEYEKNMPVNIGFPPIQVQMPLGRVIAENGLIQMHMSESEKERFVTFYFNGLRDNPFQNEERHITPSPRVPTYDLKPEMSAYEQTSELIKNMQSGKYQFIVINYANPDMVGHTGNIQASIQAIKVIDDCLSKITNVALAIGFTICITADHGNVEQKINPQTGEISTEHTSNPVPFIVIGRDYQGKMAHLQSGILADVAPTILGIMGIPKPSEMTGRNLLEELA